MAPFLHTHTHHLKTTFLDSWNVKMDFSTYLKLKKLNSNLKILIETISPYTTYRVEKVKIDAPYFNIFNNPYFSCSFLDGRSSRDGLRDADVDSVGSGSLIADSDNESTPRHKLVFSFNTHF